MIHLLFHLLTIILIIEVGLKLDIKLTPNHIKNKARKFFRAILFISLRLFIYNHHNLILKVPE